MLTHLELLIVSSVASIFARMRRPLRTVRFVQALPGRRRSRFLRKSRLLPDHR
ncbi:hypothetical protein D779_3528 [Imhoffiella purpurea]|uniref:Uncharacterized protein n=1 Tax=Imhoffiella purpurea TaxID=1249627 RepID=W9V9R0_9GAMM|nr:hypothetical protein D779_3528 [Imhoffiella purpurea]